MWGFLIGLYLAMMIYPFLEEWQRRQADKRHLAKMREHHARGRRWDTTKGAIGREGLNSAPEWHYHEEPDQEWVQRMIPR